MPHDTRRGGKQMTNRDTHEDFMRQARGLLDRAAVFARYGMMEDAKAAEAEAANKIAAALGVAERRPCLKVAA
jgi:hypothetical protein